MFRSFLRRRKKETSVLNTDSFDKRRFGQIYDMSQVLQEIERNEENPLFKELLGDIWASLYKVNPELKDPEEMEDHLQINRQLMDRAMNEETYERFRQSTKLDDLQSAIATISFGKKTSVWLEEQKRKNEEIKEQMEQIQELMKKLQQKQQEQSDQQEDNDEEKNDQQTEESDNEEGDDETQQQDRDGNSDLLAQSLDQAMSQLASQLSEALDGNSNSFSVAMNQAVKDTEETKKDMESLFGGVHAGRGQNDLKKMPLRDKIYLAEVLSKNRKVKEIARWAGKFTRIAQTKQKSKYRHSTEQSGVEQGDDLERLLPSELVLYKNKKTKKEFLRRFSEKETLQYEQKGKETLGRGSIILCLDQSVSMNHLETESKGFALALMSIAKRQRRDFAYIPFSSNALVKQFPKGKIKTNEMIEMARSFLNGGTNFAHPLEKSLKVIKKDRFKDADIIFITDGKDYVNTSFLEQFNEQKEENEFSVLSLLLGYGTHKDTVQQFSDRIIEINDFDDERAFEAFEI